jgi:hypothetical protein
VLAPPNHRLQLTAPPARDSVASSAPLERCGK